MGCLAHRCALHLESGMRLRAVLALNHAALAAHDVLALAHKADRDAVAFERRQRVGREKPSGVKLWCGPLPFGLCLWRHQHGAIGDRPDAAPPSISLRLGFRPRIGALGLRASAYSALRFAAQCGHDAPR